MNTAMEPENGDLETWLRWAGTKLTVSLAMSLYFKAPPSACAEGVLAIYKRYLELCEPHLTWFADETTGRFRKASLEVLRIPFRRLPEAMGKEKLYAWCAFAGEHHRDAAPFQFETLLNPGIEVDALSCLRAAIPVQMFRADFARFVALVKELSSLVPVYHGTAGFSFSLSMVEGAKQTDEPYLISAAMRFTGIEVNNHDGTSLSCTEAIKGVNWLTMLEHSFVKQLGGERALRERLSEPIELHQMPWGLMIQAGPEPGIGHVNAGETLPLYRDVNQALRPVRVATHFNLGVEFDEDRTRRWIGRFD